MFPAPTRWLLSLSPSNGVGTNMCNTSQEALPSGSLHPENHMWTVAYLTQFGFLFSFIGSLFLQKIKEYNAVYLITHLSSRLSYQCHFSYKSILLACYVPLWIPKTVTVTSQMLGSVSSLLMFDPTIQPFKSKISIV
jgi:hypothetical protein